MSDLTAIALKEQIESRRKSMHEDLDRKFDVLLAALSDTFEVGNLVPPAKPARKRKATVETVTTMDEVVETTTDNADPYYSSEQFHDVNISINAYLREAGTEGLSKKDLIEKCGYSDSVITDSLRHLIENGTVATKGERRGRRYVATTIATSEPTEENGT